MENKLRIADDVIAIIVELALADVPGIYASDKRKNKKNLGKGIQVKVEDDSVICDLELSIGEDVKVPQMAADLLNNLINAFVLMIVTTCVLPLFVLIGLLWVMNQVLNINPDWEKQTP